MIRLVKRRQVYGEEPAGEAKKPRPKDQTKLFAQHSRMQWRPVGDDDGGSGSDS